MTMDTGPFVYIAYTPDASDPTQHVNVKMRANVATALGYTPVARSANPVKTNTKNWMRHRWAKGQTSGNRIKFIVPAIANTKFQNMTGTVTWWDGQVYDLEGAVAEDNSLKRQR